MSARLALALAAFLVAAAGPSQAQQRPAPSLPEERGPTLPDKPPAPFAPDAAEASAPADTWIFSGELQGSHEQFSGTLLTSKTEAQFELKLASGATCDGSDLKGDVGLVRLSEITCSDDRTMRALFVPQGGQELRVFGHVGEERFVTSAHLLGSEAAPEKKQTAAPPGNAAPPSDAAPPPGDTPKLKVK